MAVRDVVQAAAGIGGDKLYVEDVFSTYLYTGNDSTQTINNGIDLAGNGGLVWAKSRAQVAAHELVDTVRGADNRLFSDKTFAQDNSGSVHAFNSNGFTLRAAGLGNLLNEPTVSWTFRKAPKFFDVVTYTGNGSSSRAIPHSLTSIPYCIMVKRTDAVANWEVFHVYGGGAGYAAELNLTNAFSSSSGMFTNVYPTADVFYVGNDSNVNASGGSYVAYLFAHNAGGFGDDGEQNVISCGSYTGNSGTNAINLGFEPQWVMVKAIDKAEPWAIFDNMRGITSGNNGSKVIYANSTAAEAFRGFAKLTATGFTLDTNEGDSNLSGYNYIYIAIRRGPMKTPESGSEVFAVDAANGSTPEWTSGFPIDMAFYKGTAGTSTNASSRLTQGSYLVMNTTAAETSNSVYAFDYMDSWGNFGAVPSTYYSWMFRRAPGFFDVVCYTGTGVARTVAHNLTVAPELMIVKSRSGGTRWAVYSAALGSSNTSYLNIETNGAVGVFGALSVWNNTNPTSSVFSIGDFAWVNTSGATYVAYLFASCPGVSKVGSYTGTGTTQQINCGFTGGARFVLIKRTDSTGDWYVWDTARGIVAGNDPYLLLNSTAAEVTSTDYVNTYSAGFEISSTAPAAINASGGSFIYLAIA